MSETITETTATEEIKSTEPTAIEKAETAVTNLKAEAEKLGAEKARLDGLRKPIRTGDESAVREMLKLGTDAEVTDNVIETALDALFVELRSNTAASEKVGRDLAAAGKILAEVKADADWANVADMIEVLRTEAKSALSELPTIVRQAAVVFGVGKVRIIARTVKPTEPADAKSVTVIPATIIGLPAFEKAFAAITDGWDADTAKSVHDTGFRTVTFEIDGWANDTGLNVSVAKSRDDSVATVKPATTTATTGNTNGASGGGVAKPVTVRGTEYPSALDAFRAHYTEIPTYAKAGKGEAWAQGIIAKAAQTNMRDWASKIPGAVV